MLVVLTTSLRFVIKSGQFLMLILSTTDQSMQIKANLKIKNKYSITGLIQRAILSFLITAILIILNTPVFAKSIEFQRKDYLAAKKALDTNQYKTFGKIANTLKDYPLYPYLRYEYLRRNLLKIKDSDIISFLERYHDLPVAAGLRKSWLKLLVKRSHWQTFLDNYTPQSDVKMECYQLQARIKTNNSTFLLEDIRTTWLAGKSLPPQCDPAFALLYKSDFMTNELVWERLRLSIRNNQLNLVNYLSNRLEPEYKELAKLWVRIYQNPYKYTYKPKLENTPIARDILAHGILRLARYDVIKAIQRLNELKEQYSFTLSDIAEIERTLAIRAAKNKSVLALQLLDKIDNKHVNKQVFHYRLSTALANYDWFTLKKWTTGQAPDIDIELRWRYWHARALEETGEPDKANEIYKEIAKERDYYGFLAADKINVAYDMNHYPIPENREGFSKVASLPAMKRSYEFYKLGMSYSARREWQHALNKMTTYQMQTAAAVASQWGWHNRAIITMHRAKAYDDLVLRFPILFSDLLDKYAKKRKIDVSWLYGLVRAESAFIEDVSSPAGALGLMQVMPKTGQYMAKYIGLKDFKTSKLKKAGTNIPIGSAYMKKMLADFNGNIVLATAAYNAGPHRVSKWLPKKGCEESDVWVEKIPFDETRKYVRRVLAFANIYDWRLELKVKPINKRMPIIMSKNHVTADNSSCAGINTSDNKHVN
jgi:soluble lytic murein transglycosylase